MKLLLKTYIYSLLECQRGTYGVNCSGLCGHCSDLSECSRIDGSCLTGCDNGYHGRLCEKGNSKYLCFIITFHTIYFCFVEASVLCQCRLHFK